MNTSQKILNKALEMFNERGIEYVGLRELAGLLGIRVSNITYYFPTKDDLVNALSLELRQLNSEVMVEREQLSMLGFLQMLHQVFQHHYRYRCLLLSFVHLMEQNKVMAARYRDTQQHRNATLQSNLAELERNGYLKTKGEQDREYLVSALALIARFWISEAMISYRHLSAEEQMLHYLTMITKLLEPYATKQAKAEVEQFLASF